MTGRCWLGGARWVRPGDCRELMAAIGDGEVSLILTDPPYFIDGMGDDWDAERIRERTKPGVVGGVPAGQRFDAAQSAALYDFMVPVAAECARVLRPGGFALCFAQPRLYHRPAQALEDAGLEMRDALAWCRPGQAKAAAQQHRVAGDGGPPSPLSADLGDRKTPQLKSDFELIALAQKPRDGTFADNWAAHGTGLVDVAAPLLGGGFPSTLVACPKPRDRHGHPTAKPVDLCRHLIRIFGGRRGGLVLDPFAGSGTTGVAARNEGWDFAGFELDADMAAKAESRIAGAGEGAAPEPLRLPL